MAVEGKGSLSERDALAECLDDEDERDESRPERAAREDGRNLVAHSASPDFCRSSMMVSSFLFSVCVS